jgi:hypothetical protein
MALYVPNRPVYEHSQDAATFCARASAQMVISSLVLGPPTGNPPTPADEKDEIPVTQDELRRREQYPNDDVYNESWFTHPDELLKLMKEAPELAGQTDWRLAVEGDIDGIYAELILALQGGMPAILNVYNNDHWVVIAGVGVDDATSKLNFMIALDPLPQLTEPVVHTYIDDCKQEGLTYVETADDSDHEVELGGLQLEICSRPHPSDLTDYAGKCVALVYGPGWNRELADKLRKLRRLPVPPYLWQPKAPLSATISQSSIDEMQQALLSRAQSWEIPRLSTVLSSPHEHVARLVQDVRGALYPYYLLSLFSPALGYGVVGAFKVRDHQPLHFRFTNNRKFAQSLQKRPLEPLWWTRRWLPSLKSPYFPFARQVVGNKYVYQRLFDDFVYESDVPHGV